MGEPNPSLKGRALVNIINQAIEPYGTVDVYEDSAANLQAMEQAVKNNPDITFQGNLVHLSKESLLRRFISNLLSEMFVMDS